jgi:hypothetical protein
MLVLTEPGLQHVTTHPAFTADSRTLGLLLVAGVVFWPFGRFGLRSWTTRRWLARTLVWWLALAAYFLWVLVPAAVDVVVRALPAAMITLATLGLVRPPVPPLPAAPPGLSQVLWLGPPLLALVGWRWARAVGARAVADTKSRAPAA